MTVQRISIGQMQAARLALGWTQEDLALRSGLSAATIRRIEAHHGDLGERTQTGGAIKRALEGAGMVFTLGDSPQPSATGTNRSG